MCGIFGLLNNNQPVESKDLRILSDSMLHRGPDDSGLINKSNWSIGMRRLSIIDLSGGHQPISNQSNDIHLVCNGEIFNHKQLRKNLINLGYRFKTKSDVEVILHLYQEYGRDSIHHLNGMFAFAIYDESKDMLWIARDRLGIKPLYYGWKNSCFGFSSELTGLAKIFDSEICETSLIDYLGYSYVPAPKTIFKNISKLLPGEELILSGGIATKNQYWNCSQRHSWNGTIDEAQRKLDSLLKGAIQKQLISDVPLGIFLSGGVDSSAIASYASEINTGAPIQTFTIDFEEKNGEDSLYASKLSEDIKSDHHTLKVSADDQFNALNELIPLMDEPMSDSAIVPTYMLAKAARNKGIKVLLSGAGGDEIFGGYARHFPSKILTAGWLASLPKFIRYMVAFVLGKINPSHAIRLLNPSRNFIANISGLNFAFLKEALISKEQFSYLLSRIESDYKDASSTKAYPLMMMDINDYLPNNILSLTDKATMATSVEGRVPLLDHEIVEFAFSLPESMNILNNNPKGLFKKTLETRLPASLISRKKEGFNAPINLWVANWPDKIKDELINNLSPEITRIIKPAIIEKWLNNESLRSKAGPSIYALFVLNKWIRSNA